MLFFEKYFRQKSISQNISNEVQDQNNFSWNHDPSGNMNIIFFNKGNLQVKYKVLFHDFFCVNHYFLLRLSFQAR